MAARTGTAKRTAKRQEPSDAAVSYDEFKEYEGHKYTGMKVGRSHKWYYDQGEWKETKITPDLWQIRYAVTKRRAGRAPEGSGVPVGTEYHWYILAHQNVQKLNANDYTTSLAGLKFKIAHKRADTEKWSATPKTQRKRMINFLQGVIAELEQVDEHADKTHRSRPVTSAHAPASGAAKPRKKTKRTGRKLTKKAAKEPIRLPAGRRRKPAAR